MPGVQRASVGVSAGSVGVLHAGAGDPIVLLHGVPTSAELWRFVADRIAAGGRLAIAPDLPGCGTTRLASTADVSLRGCAEIVAELLATEIGPAWLVGHDLGGAVAAMLAVRHPDLATGLTLVDAVADTAFPALRARVGIAAARLGLVAIAARLRLVPNPLMDRAIRRGFANGHFADVDLHRVCWDTKFRDESGAVEFQRFLAALRPADVRSIADDLPRAQVRAQLVWGLRDVYQRWEVAGARWQALLPAARVTLLPECGHFVPIECPDRLADAVLAAIDEVRR